MSVSSYSVAGAISGYGTQSTSQTSSKPFTIPVWGEDIGKTNNATQKTENNDKTNNAKTDPFKACTFDFKDWCSKLDPTYDIGMYTKTEPTRSDEEILKDIAELAKKHAQQGTFYKQDQEYLDLMKEYVSSASPDRESILNRTMNEIMERTNQSENYSMSFAFQQMNLQKSDKKEEEEKELIDYFIEAFKSKGNGKGSSGTISSITKNGDYYTVDVDYGGGKKTTLNYTNSGEFVSMQMQGNNYYVGGINNYSGAVENVEFKDDNGNLIAAHNQNGFYSILTSAEAERMSGFAGAYYAGYDFALGKYSPPQPPDKSYKEAYESTYEKLANSAVA